MSFIDFDREFIINRILNFVRLNKRGKKLRYSFSSFIKDIVFRKGNTDICVIVLSSIEGFADSLTEVLFNLRQKWLYLHQKISTKRNAPSRWRKST